MSNTIKFHPTIKQDLVFELFEDNSVTEILYGGSAGSAKSILLSALIIFKCIEKPGIRIGLGRNELTTLKKTTVVSFFELCGILGLTVGKDFNYNSTSGLITFSNGSEVVLIELTHKPSDPEYTRLGGLLLTFALVDEATEISEKAFNILKSRTGRWKNVEFGVGPKMIMTCNPYKNWLYREFYKPSLDNTLKSYRRFIQALPTDNQYLPQSYLDNLQTLPLIDRERLLLGNWDYADEDNQLISYQNIINMYKDIPGTNDKKYITADIAMTSDKCVVLLWNDLTIEKVFVNPEGKVEDFIIQLAKENGVSRSSIAYDSDGVGKYLMHSLRGAVGIVNNAAPLKRENYKNLKTQMFYRLADEINKYNIKIADTRYQEEINEEISTIKHKPTSKVGKLEILSKDEVKKIIGRSPDFADAMAYRMYFLYKNNGRPF